MHGLRRFFNALLQIKFLLHRPLRLHLLAGYLVSGTKACTPVYNSCTKPFENLSLNGMISSVQKKIRVFMIKKVTYLKNTIKLGLFITSVELHKALQN